jgi:hypothetical protein
MAGEARGAEDRRREHLDGVAGAVGEGGDLTRGEPRSVAEKKAHGEIVYNVYL